MSKPSIPHTVDAITIERCKRGFIIIARPGFDRGVASDIFAFDHIDDLAKFLVCNFDAIPSTPATGGKP